MAQKDLGMVTSYAYALSQGYTGTEEEFAEGVLASAEYADNAQASATAAAQSKIDAEAAASSVQASAQQIATNTADIADIKSDLSDGYLAITPSIIGSMDGGGTLITTSKVLRTGFIPVKVGDKVVIDNGSLKHGVKAWKNSVSWANSVRNDTTWRTDDESIIITFDGYIAIIFAKTDDTQDISVSDFDGYIHAYDTAIYHNEYDISVLGNKLDSIIGKTYQQQSVGDIGTKIAGYSFGVSGNNVAGSTNASYDSYYFYTDKDTAMYFESVAPSTPTYIALTVGYNPAKSWNFPSGGGMQMLCTSAVRKRKSESNLPVQASPMNVADAIVIITVNVNTSASFYINNKLLLDSDVALNSTQVNQVISSIPAEKCPKLQYRSVSEWDNEKSSEQVDIYLPTDNGYVRYAFGHSIDNDINANSWRILRALATDDTLTDRFAITTHGEWEMAVKIDGGTDFIGGILHGDEVLDSLRFYVDGEAVTISSFTTITDFTELRIVEFTDLYDPDEQTDNVATHIKEYIFTADGLTLNQQIKWLMAKTLTTSYCCMFPLIRGNDTVSELQVTGKYYDNNDYKVYDVSVGGFEGYPATWHTGVTKAHLYASASKVFASAEMVKQPSLAGGNQSFLQNTANQYNKLYYAICGIGTTCNVAVNDKWEVESKYTISVA